MAKYIYPAIFSPESDGGYSVEFPDISGCFTCGDTLEDSLDMAADALALMLVHMEDENRQIPTPSSINMLEMKGDEFASLISADTILYRKTLSNIAVKKTLTIPQYLDQAGIAAGINFSQLLQDALKERLHLA